MRNIFAMVPENVPEEIIEDILSTDSIKIERIISDGQASPEGYWYDQDRDEWVILIQGGAGLLFEGDENVKVLKPGDYLHIPAHKKHRVAWTIKEEKTIWLAVHY